MNYLITLLACILLMITQSCKTVKFDMDFLSYQKDFENVVRTYDKNISELNLGFAALSIKDNTTSTASAGTGNFNANTVFNIGSASKKLTSILILQELDKGTLLLSDSIGTYLSALPNVDGALTIELLLRHQSGLGELIDQGAEKMFFSHHDSLYSSDFLMKIPSPKSGMVGKYEYCNTNYLLLGRILERITDRKYFDLLQERIFDPCKMVNSYPYVSKNIKNLAPPSFDGNDVSAELDSRFYTEYCNSAGSVASSLNDMSKFYQSLFESKILLTDASLTKFISFGEAEYGLGIMKIEHEDVTYYGHGGNNIGYGFREYYNPLNGDLLLYFSNNMLIPFGKYIQEDLLDFMAYKSGEVITKSSDILDYTNIAGSYFFEEMNMELPISEHKGNLYLTVQGNKLLLFKHPKKGLLAAYFGIELKPSADKKDVLIFSQNGMNAEIKKIK